MGDRKPILALDFDSYQEISKGGNSPAVLIMEVLEFFEVYLVTADRHAAVDALLEASVPASHLEALIVGYDGPLAESRVKFVGDRPANTTVVVDKDGFSFTEFVDGPDRCEIVLHQGGRSQTLVVLGKERGDRPLLRLSWFAPGWSHERRAG